MFNNFATMLNSLDNIAQENLEEPKISATSLRQQKKEAAESNASLSSLDVAKSCVDSESEAVASMSLSHVSKHNSEASFVVVEENENHSELTTSPKSTMSNSSLNDYVSAPTSRTGKLETGASSTSVSSLSESRKSSLPADKEARQVIMAKNKEIEKLNSECLELEAQNEGLKQEVRDAWEAYKSSQEKAALREADYQEDMSQLERAKSTDREGMTAHVKSMEKELESKRTEMKSIRAEHDRVTKLMHALQEETNEWMSTRDSLEARLKVAEANNNQSLQGLREELRQKDSYIETLQSEHSIATRSAHQRHDDLEQANSDLTATLMSKERELTKLSQMMQQSGSGGGRDGLLQSELSKLRVQLDEARENLVDEQEAHQSCMKRLRASEQELDINRTSWEDEKQMLLDRISEITSQLSTQNDESRSPNKNQYADNHDQNEEKNRLEEQLRTLGQQLLRKQESLEAYLSERAALKVRLQDSQRRCKKYEDQVTSLLESADPYDFEANVGGPPDGVRRSDSGNLRKRGGSTNGSGGSDRLNRPVRASQDLEKLGVHAGPRVTNVVDTIDTWTLITGRHLKAYPLLRLTFVLYLVFIHIWAFCLLAYHAHIMDLDNATANDMTNNKLIK